MKSLPHALALFRHGSYAKAARELNLSQPSLTRRIAQLEADLGVRLFDRTPRGVLPTAFGRLLAERGELLLRDEGALRRQIRQLAGLESGLLCVGAAPYPTEISVGPALARLATAHPQLRLLCRTRDPVSILQEVLRGTLDVGIGLIPPAHRDARVSVVELPPQRLYMACRPGHPLVGPEVPSFAQVLRYPLVTTMLRGVHADAVARSGDLSSPLDADAPDLSPPIQVDSLGLGRKIAASSDAVIPVTAAMAANEIAAGQLVLLATDAPVLRTSHSLMFLRHRTLSPAAQAFVDHVVEIETELQKAGPQPRDILRGLA